MGELALHPAAAWAPQTGPQETFAQTSAEFAVIGGGPGGGKSVAVLGEWGKLTLLRRVRGLRGVAFRRTEVALEKPGSVWDRAQQMLPAFGGRVLRDARSVIHEAASGQIEDQHRIDFMHLHSEDSVRIFDGTELDFVAFDELQDFTAAQVFYMLSRLRSMSGLRPRIRGNCNAEPDSWLAEFLISGGYIGADGYAIPEMSGVVRWFVRDEETDEFVWFDSEADAYAAIPGLQPGEAMSFTFVLARTSDNRKLAAHDPGYRGRLRHLPRKDRVRLRGEGGVDRGGNWLSAAGAGVWFAKDAIKFVDAPPSRVVRWSRAWDFGSIASDEEDWKKGPDWTEGPLVGWCESGDLWIGDVASCRKGPIETDEFLVEVSIADGPLVEVGLFQDAGSAGKRDAENTKALVEKQRLTAQIVRSDRNHNETDAAAAQTLRAKKGARSSLAKQALARPWALLARQGRVYASNTLPAKTKEKLRVQTFRFPNGPKDDLIDGISCGVVVLKIDVLTMMDAIGIAVRKEAEAKAAADAERRRQEIELRELARIQAPELDVEGWLSGRRT